MKKIIPIAIAAVAAMSIAFTIGFAAGKANEQSQPAVWVDSTGEIYVAR